MFRARGTGNDRWTWHVRRPVLAAVLALTVLAGAGAAVLATGPTANAQGVVTLKFMRPGRFDVVERVFRPIVTAFEKENPGIQHRVHVYGARRITAAGALRGRGSAG